MRCGIEWAVKDEVILSLGFATVGVEEWFGTEVHLVGAEVASASLKPCEESRLVVQER